MKIVVSVNLCNVISDRHLHSIHHSIILFLLQKKVKAGELIDVAHRDSDVHEGDFFSLFYYDDCERSSDQYTVKIKQKVSCILLTTPCMKLSARQG